MAIYLYILYIFLYIYIILCCQQIATPTVRLATQNCVLALLSEPTETLGNLGCYGPVFTSQATACSKISRGWCFQIPPNLEPDFLLHIIKHHFLTMKAVLMKFILCIILQACNKLTTSFNLTVLVGNTT